MLPVCGDTQGIRTPLYRRTRFSRTHYCTLSIIDDDHWNYHEVAPRLTWSYENAFPHQKRARTCPRDSWVFSRRKRLSCGEDVTGRMMEVYIDGYNPSWVSWGGCMLQAGWSSLLLPEFDYGRSYGTAWMDSESHDTPETLDASVKVLWRKCETHMIESTDYQQKASRHRDIVAKRSRWQRMEPSSTGRQYHSPHDNEISSRSLQSKFKFSLWLYYCHLHFRKWRDGEKHDFAQSVRHP